MYYLATFEEGSNVQGLARAIKRSGAGVEVISTPMKLTDVGCGLSIKLKKQHFTVLKSKIMDYNISIRNIYQVRQEGGSLRYDKV